MEAYDTDKNAGSFGECVRFASSEPERNCEQCDNSLADDVRGGSNQREQVSNRLDVVIVSHDRPEQKQ